MITADLTSPSYRIPFLEYASEVELLYAPVEFHHFGHAMEEVFPGARLIAHTLMRQDVQINLRAIDKGSIGHDALVHVPLTGTRYASKEERTADVIGHILLRTGEPEEDVIATQGVIISTNMEEALLTPEDAVMNYADIINIAGDYDAMLQKTYNYWIETMRLSNNYINPDEWLSKSIEILTKYLNKELPPQIANLHPFGMLRDRMIANLERMKQETGESFLQKITPLPTAPVFS